VLTEPVGLNEFVGPRLDGADVTGAVDPPPPESGEVEVAAVVGVVVDVLPTGSTLVARTWSGVNDG
jgi:hypothetical protein